MFSIKRWMIISALLGVVVGVLADGWVAGLIASLSLGLVLMLVDRWTTPEEDFEFGQLEDEEPRDLEPAPEPPPTPKTDSLR